MAGDEPPLRRVVWTAPAIDDLTAIRAYIAAMNPGAAERVASALLRGATACRSIAFGRRAGATRQFVAVAPYAIRYRVEPEEVIIMRVRHGRRRRV